MADQQPDPAPWRMDSADEQRLHGAVVTVQRRGQEFVQAAVALGIVPDPRQHGPNRCSPAAEHGPEKCVPRDGRIECGEPVHRRCGFPDAGDCYRHGRLHGIGECIPIAEHPPAAPAPHDVPLTEGLDLEPIRVRAERATGGPWRHVDRSDVIAGEYVGGMICRVWPNMKNVHADAEFIANARQDIHTLIAEVERLRAAAPMLVPGEHGAGKCVPDDSGSCVEYQAAFATGYKPFCHTHGQPWPCNSALRAALTAQNGSAGS